MSLSAKQLPLEERLRVWAIMQPEHGDFRRELLAAREEIIDIRAELDASRVQAEALAEALVDLRDCVEAFVNDDVGLPEIGESLNKADSALAAYRKGLRE